MIIAVVVIQFIFLLQGKICTNSDQQEKREIFDSFDILLFH